MISLPTYITLSRIALTPLIMYKISHNRWIEATLFFALAAITDGIDGALARFYKCSTPLGACLDAFADKVLLLGCFSALYWYHPTSMPLWFLIGVLCKEICIVLGSIYVGLIKGWHAIRPTLTGKSLTLMQFLYCLWALLCELFVWAPFKSQRCALICLGMLMIIALVDYAKRGLKL